MDKEGVLKRIKDALAGVNQILVCSHVDPDADTIGSMIATSLMLKDLGLEVDMFCQDAVPHTYDFLPHIKEIKRSIPENIAYDLIITVDAGDEKRVFQGREIFKLNGFA